ncbi:MAG: tyrosine--tRNA ligase [Deltaproteobacteria bacterium]|jgi:tyrosyl-tRNA synthetase|nr:tyrosine--tRNA ligase [Deltaproteobacteria bacterium]
MTRQNAHLILQERGFNYQVTDEEGLLELFSREEVTAYIGFDATADSLHVGHLLPLMALSWLSRCGHKPIALLGGGTSMVGDPSGRKEARKILSLEDISANAKGIGPQLKLFIDLSEGKGLMCDNSQWLAQLNYVSFIRDIGRHFSVNRMLTAESYKSRLETGLSFLEFNYMVMQAYDFLVLYKEHGCRLQLGGQDQWGNIVAGIELIRRETGGSAFGVTMPLLIDPRTGEKFGKTNQGAVWLSKERTPVYDFYQFWRNVDDQETFRLLCLFTFLPLEECRYLSTLEGNLVNRAKEILAFEVTSICHGHAQASEAFLASAGAFGYSDPELIAKTSSRIVEAGALGKPQELPTVTLTREQLASSDLATLFVLASLASTKGEARRLIRQGGAYANDMVLPQDAEKSSALDFFLNSDSITLRAGKKRYKTIKAAP